MKLQKIKTSIYKDYQQIQINKSIYKEKINLLNWREKNYNKIFNFKNFQKKKMKKQNLQEMKETSFPQKIMFFKEKYGLKFLKKNLLKCKNFMTVKQNQDQLWKIKIYMQRNQMENLSTFYQTHFGKKFSNKMIKFQINNHSSLQTEQKTQENQQVPKEIIKIRFKKIFKLKQGKQTIKKFTVLQNNKVTLYNKTKKTNSQKTQLLTKICQENTKNQKSYLQEKIKKFKIYNQCQNEEKNKNTQINTILEELLLNYRGIEVQVKEEIMQNQKKMQQLENELSKKDEMIKMDYDKAKEELLTSMGKLQEAQNIITQLQNQLQNEQQEKQEIMKEFELNKSQLLKKVAELNSEVAKVLSKSDQEVSKIKIENLKNKQQAMQLMTMLTERENEIATLRIKITQNDEELKRLRKKNISITGEITGPYKPHLCQQINQNRSDIKLASLITPAKSTLKAESFQNSKGFSLPNINFNNKRNRGRSLHTKVNNEMQLGDGDPFFKIRFIRTIKEWAVYWKYYNDDYQVKLQLLDKLLTTKKLREDFSISQDIKLQVLKEAINSSEEEMFETITHLLAELLDLNQLNKEELEDLDIGSRVVRSLRVPKDGEDEREFTNLQISGLKILSFMDMENMHWSQHMSEELMNVNGLKCLSESIKQTEKQWIRMLAFQTLHLMASQKALIPFMISYKINSELLLSIEEMSNEVIVASLGYFSALLKDEQFINSISDIKGLLKLNELLFHQDPGVVANTLLCINNVIPNFTYHKSLYKENVLQKIGDIAGHSIDIKTRLHALKLIRTLIDHGTEMEIDQINEIVLPQLLENILLPYNETLKEISPERDLILQTLKITSSIIEDFQHPDEEKLAEYILKLLCHSEIKNDPKIEKNTTEIVFKLWKTSEDLMVQNMIKEDIMLNICDRYLKRQTNDDLITYGFMLNGIVEKQTMNSLLIKLRGEQLISYLIENARSNDFKVAQTAFRLLLFLTLEKSCYIHFKLNNIQNIIKLLKKPNITDDFLQMGLEIVFNLMKSQTLFNYFYQNDIFNLIFDLVFFKKKKNTKVLQNAFSCIEMIIIQSLPERKEFRERFLINKNGYKYLQCLLQTSLAQNDREFGKHVHFIYKYLSEEGKEKYLIKQIYNVSEDYIKLLVQAKYNYKKSTPENTNEINRGLQVLSYQSKPLQQLLTKYENIYKQENGQQIQQNEDNDIIQD